MDAARRPDQRLSISRNFSLKNPAKNQQWHRETAIQSLNTIAKYVLFIDRVEDNAFSFYDLIWPCPSTRTPAPRGHEIYNYGTPFLGYHYFLKPCLGVKKKKNINFTLFTP